MADLDLSETKLIAHNRISVHLVLSPRFKSSLGRRHEPPEESHVGNKTKRFCLNLFTLPPLTGQWSFIPYMPIRISPTYQLLIIHLFIRKRKSDNW